MATPLPLLGLLVVTSCAVVPVAGLNAAEPALPFAAPPETPRPLEVDSNSQVYNPAQLAFPLPPLNSPTPTTLSSSTEAKPEELELAAAPPWVVGISGLRNERTGRLWPLPAGEGHTFSESGRYLAFVVREVETLVLVDLQRGRTTFARNRAFTERLDDLSLRNGSVYVVTGSVNHLRFEQPSLRLIAQHQEGR